MPRLITNDAHMLAVASGIAREGRTPTAGELARRIGMSPSGVAWRLRRLRREDRWPYPSDIRAGHPFWGNGYASSDRPPC